MTKTPVRQATTSLVLLLTIVSAVWYGVMLFNPLYVGHPVAYLLLQLAELLGMFQLLGAWLSILIAPQPAESYQVFATKHALQKHHKLAGRVVVFVPVAGEPLEIIRQTLLAARDMRVTHRTVVLDDGRSTDVRDLARQLGIEYLSRDTRQGWKAGNINFGLAHVPSDFFAIIDSDFIAKPEFLEELLAPMLVDSELAFVQAPQVYGNEENFVAGGSSQSQLTFYRHLQSAKNSFNSAFSVGTNVVFRTSAVMEIGGMYDKSPSEDIWTSVLLHERGWKSFYTPKVLAIGLAPESFEVYFRQQFRWAKGGFEVLLDRMPLFSRRLTLDQRLQYFHTTSHFLTGFSVLTFFILPLLYVYFGWKPLQLPSANVWLMHFAPYYILTFLTTAHLMGAFPRWRAIVVSMSAFPYHLAAVLGALFGFEMRWRASGAIRRNIDYIKSVALHILLLLLSLGAVPVLYFTDRGDPYVMGMMTFWLCLNSLVLFSICKRAIPKHAQYSTADLSVSLPALA